LGGLTWRIAALFKAFDSPTTSLPDLDASAAAALIAAASDLALVIDETGAILDVSLNSEDLARDLDIRHAWLHRPWADTVTPESRPKVDMLLRDAAASAAPRWRHLNHPSHRGATVPILYSAVRVGDAGRVVAFGRDLRAVSELQQRLVDAQQSLEHDYARLRDMETRYRLLFQMSSEAVVILDAATLRVSEANPAAHALFGTATKRVLARGLVQAFAPQNADSLSTLLNTVRAVGRGEEVHATLEESGQEVVISASLFREGTASLMLVRLTPAEHVHATAASSAAQSKLLALVESAPDGFVVIGADGRIITANAAFLAQAQLANEDQARGQNLDRWLGRQGVDVAVLIANLRQRGSMRLFATIIRGEAGTTTQVEVSGVALANGGQPCFGLATRDVGRRLSAEPANGEPRSAEHLAELIGRVPLKELVRQSTDVIERLCIETALNMTGDNRASAAEMLGLSRQSFYVKLRRYGLGDLATEAGDAS
jgi:transcriptional regulator PpsR